VFVIVDDRSWPFITDGLCRNAVGGHAATRCTVGHAPVRRHPLMKAAPVRAATRRRVSRRDDNAVSADFIVLIVAPIPGSLNRLLRIAPDDPNQPALQRDTTVHGVYVSDFTGLLAI
jgi:hypothetical protein